MQAVSTYAFENDPSAHATSPAARSGTGGDLDVARQSAHHTRDLLEVAMQVTRANHAHPPVGAVERHQQLVEFTIQVARRRALESVIAEVTGLSCQAIKRVEQVTRPAVVATRLLFHVASDVTSRIDEIVGQHDEAIRPAVAKVVVPGQCGRGQHRREG